MYSDLSGQTFVVSYINIKFKKFLL